MSKPLKLWTVVTEGLVGARFQWFPMETTSSDELEKLLEFSDSQNQFERFLGRISKAADNRMDEVVQELRTAFFFYRNGFPICRWEPSGLLGKIGEYSLRADRQEVFVEVKSPGWEAELSPEEIKAGRTKQPKYIQGDARAVAPWLQVRDCMKRAYCKFTDAQPNLLVIADDFHMSLTEEDDSQFEIALFEKTTVFNKEAGYFANSSYERLGGIGIFSVRLTTDGLAYAYKGITNPFSLERTRVPQSLGSLSEEGF